MNSDRCEISVIIPAFNEEKILARTIERIALAFDENEERGISWELIICDNGSTDLTA